MSSIDKEESEDIWLKYKQPTESDSKKKATELSEEELKNSTKLFGNMLVYGTAGDIESNLEFVDPINYQNGK